MVCQAKDTEITAYFEEIFEDWFTQYTKVNFK